MSDTIFLKPAFGKLVRDPVSFEPLPESGAEKPRTPHWLRRLRDGDVVEVRRPEPAKTRAGAKEETTA